MNPATNIIYKAKSVSGEWVKGGYYHRLSPPRHVIVEPKNTWEHDINPDTLCIGCVIDGKEYFAGDKINGGWGVIEFTPENGFALNINNYIYPVTNANNFQITGNIHD